MKNKIIQILSLTIITSCFFSPNNKTENNIDDIYGEWEATNTTDSLKSEINITFNKTGTIIKNIKLSAKNNDEWITGYSHSDTFPLIVNDTFPIYSETVKSKKYYYTYKIIKDSLMIFLASVDTFFTMNGHNKTSNQMDVFGTWTIDSNCISTICYETSLIFSPDSFVTQTKTTKTTERMEYGATYYSDYFLDLQENEGGTQGLFYLRNNENIKAMFTRDYNQGYKLKRKNK